MDDETLQMTMLFDFFGELLTEKQREYFDLYHNEDLSLSEIAEKAGISRQGVFDIIARAEKSLLLIEQKTGVVQKWLNTYAEIGQAEKIARELMSLSGGESRSAALSQKLVLLLQGLKC